MKHIKKIDCIFNCSIHTDNAKTRVLVINMFIKWTSSYNIKLKRSILKQRGEVIATITLREQINQFDMYFKPQSGKRCMMCAKVTF